MVIENKNYQRRKPQGKRIGGGTKITQGKKITNLYQDRYQW